MMENEIHLYGSVGGGFWDEDFFTPTGVREMLADRAGPLTVRINSGGGIATDGQAIYTMLVDYPGEVHVVIDGIAASAASLIAMAGDSVTMREGSLLMIHDPAQPFTEGRGTEDDHMRVVEGLRVMSGVYAGVYAKAAGMSPDAAREIMRAETYFDAAGALEAGFATATDEETQAQAFARFDYRIYANAPQKLREASGDFATVRSRQAVTAMMAGQSAPQTKESTMQDEEEMTAEVSEETEAETTAEAVAEEGETEASAASAQAEEEGTATADSAAPATAQQIRDLCAASGRSEAEALDMIVANLSLPQAVARINAKRAEENPVTAQAGGALRTRITRDERTTRRTGMMQAVVAQIMLADPVSSQARPFMDMSLAEMAAACIDHRGPLRTAGQRLQVFMDASHSTSDFPGIFENALNKVLLERYQVAEPTYRRISRRRNFTDFRVHPMVRAGDFPKLQPIGENGEIKYGTMGEARETAILSSYGVAVKISRQMMINDELGAIDQLLSDYGQSVADFEEETFYAFFQTANLSDGNPVFRTQRGNLAGSGTAISVDSVAAGRAAIRKQTTVDGKKMNMSPAILLVGPDKETEAEQLVAAIQPQEAGKVNPFSGRLEVVTTAQITGNPWYLMASADRPGGACFVHGYLEGAEAPRVRTEEAFGQQGMAMSLEHDFGLGAIDYRGGYKNPGA